MRPEYQLIANRVAHLVSLPRNMARWREMSIVPIRNRLGFPCLSDEDREFQIRERELIEAGHSNDPLIAERLRSQGCPQEYFDWMKETQEISNREKPARLEELNKSLREPSLEDRYAILAALHDGHTLGQRPSVFCPSNATEEGIVRCWELRAMGSTDMELDLFRQYLAEVCRDLKTNGCEGVEGLEPWIRRDLGLDLNESVDARQAEEATTPPGGPAVVTAQETPTAGLANNGLIALLRVFTNGISDERIERAQTILADNQMTANDKLTKIDALIPFPPTTSAEHLGGMLGVTKQAVLKTPWWIQNRKGEKESEVGRRRDAHRNRAEGYEDPNPDDEE